MRIPVDPRQQPAQHVVLLDHVPPERELLRELQDLGPVNHAAASMPTVTAHAGAAGTRRLAPRLGRAGGLDGTGAAQGSGTSSLLDDYFTSPPTESTTVIRADSGWPGALKR